MYKTMYKEVEVDVDLTDFETDDLLDELESRGALPVGSVLVGYNFNTP